MISWLVRSIKRLLIFSVGTTVIYISVWELFPFLDNRVPIALALLVTYLFTAYVFAPALIRIYRLFFRPNHIPLYCVTPDGFASDPLNIGIIGTRVQIRDAMKEAGWFMPDKKNLRSFLRVLQATIQRKSYPHTPFSRLFLFGRSQDLGFSLPINGSSSNRHHVRFWACHFDGPEAFHEHVRFWQRLHRPTKLGDNRQLWVGAASKDVGIIPIKHNLQLTHMIDPNTDEERDIIVKALKESKQLRKVTSVKIGAPYELRNRTIGGYFKADGTMKICILKD